MMQKKDYRFVVLAPLPVLLIPLVGNVTVEGWNWHWNDFVFAWVILAVAMLVYRLIATSRFANLTYKLGAALAVLTGFFVVWVTAAVRIIGEENPGNFGYALVVLTGLTGVGLSRFRPAGLARASFATALVTLLVPVVAVIFWPADFSPGIAKVFLLNGVLAAMFATAGLLFRHAAGQTATPQPA